MGWAENDPLSQEISYAKSTTSSASDALIYDAASVIFLVAYFTKILVGLRYSASHSAAWRSIMCDIMM